MEVLFIVPAVLFVAATVVYPLIYNLAQGFFEVGIAEVVRGGAEFLGLENFIDQFSREAFWSAFGISMLYTVTSLILTLLLGLALAAMFNLDFPGRNVMRALLLLAWILPTVVAANVWRWLLDGSYGLLNAALKAVGIIDGNVFWLNDPGWAMSAVVVATAWSLAPFAMLLLLAGLQTISPVLYEAARIDGASAWRRFRSITLPLLRPVALTTALLSFIFIFKTFDTIFLMTGGGPNGATTTLPLYAYDLAFGSYDFGLAAVPTTVLLIVPAVLAIFYFRSLRSEETS